MMEEELKLRNPTDEVEAFENEASPEKVAATSESKTPTNTEKEETVPPDAFNDSFPDDFNLSGTIETTVMEDLSMYSKYKRSNPAENSIANYRPRENSSKDSVVEEESEEEADENVTGTGSNSNCEHEQVIVIDSSDDDDRLLRNLDVKSTPKTPNTRRFFSKSRSFGSNERGPRRSERKREGSLDLDDLNSSELRPRDQCSSDHETSVFDDAFEEAERLQRDFRGMSTPELNNELNKYGVKPQSKRIRAIRLLEHLRDELRSAARSESDDDEEPPLKKVSQSEGNDLPKSQNSDNSPVDFTYLEEVESDAADDEAVESSRDLRQSFLRLMRKDDELYKRILTYQPLDLESLRQTLKSQGVKFKAADLIRLLDEECITFKVPQKKPRKKRY